MLVGTKASDGFLFAVGVTVAVVPEGLLPTVTLSLAIGAQRMAARRALVRHLEAVETLGSTTFIATDKTGTLTRNEMVVVEVWMPSGTTVVTGGGYTPEAEVDCTPPSSSVDAMELARTAALCSSGRAIEVEGSWVARGDPMEAALDAFARRIGVAIDEERERTTETARFPFDVRRRRMSVVRDGTVMVKGATDAVFPRCLVPPGATESLQEMAGRGLRVLAIAARPVDGIPSTVDDAETDLALLGLVGLEDPPRPHAAEALSACRRAGIRVAMVTGDHPLTARAIAAEVGLLGGDDVVVTGREPPHRRGAARSAGRSRRTRRRSRDAGGQAAHRSGASLAGARCGNDRRRSQRRSRAARGGHRRRDGEVGHRCCS